MFSETETKTCAAAGVPGASAYPVPTRSPLWVAGQSCPSHPMRTPNRSGDPPLSTLQPHGGLHARDFGRPMGGKAKWAYPVPAVGPDASALPDRTLTFSEVPREAVYAESTPTNRI